MDQACMARATMAAGTTDVATMAAAPRPSIEGAASDGAAMEGVPRARRGPGRPARGARIAAASLLAALAAGCATESNVARDYAAAPGAVRAGMTVAVLPLENLTTYPNAGRIVAELVSTELNGAGTFDVVESGELERRLRSHGIAYEASGPRPVAADVARVLGVDAVLTGSVSEYGYQHGLREEPTVGVNLRLVAAAGGVLAWTSSHSSTGGGLFRRASVNEAAQRVVARMVEALSAAAGR